MKVISFLDKSGHVYKIGDFIVRIANLKHNENYNGIFIEVRVLVIIDFKTFC